MPNKNRWLSYDTFKLVVALLLLALFIILLLNPGPMVTSLANQELPPLPSANTAATEIAPTPSPLPPTPTQPPAPTETPPPTPTQAPTSTPPPTEAPTAAPTEAPADTATPQPAALECTSPAPSRLTAGGQARIIANLNIRSSPEIDNNIIRVNPVGMILKVIAGPQCVPYQDGAYLWWNVESPDGQQGWSAENRLNGSAYYLEPVQ